MEITILLHLSNFTTNVAIYVTSKAYIKLNTIINNSVNRQQSCLVTFCMCLNSFIVTVPWSGRTYLLEMGYYSYVLIFPHIEANT